MEPDEFEHIPWSTLVAEHRDRRSKVLYVGAGVIGALALGIVGARVIAPPSPGVVVEPVVAGTDAEQLADPLGAVAAAAGVTVTTEADLLSEADLMAVLPDGEMRAASAWAEVMVTRFFTVDGADGGGDLFRGLVAVDDELRLPHDEAGPLTYVEWARSVDLAPTEGGGYRVTVAFGMLADSGDGFERQPVRAVAVEVELGSAGPPTLASLPEPVTIETPIGTVSNDRGLQSIPADVADTALRALQAWGDTAVIVGGRPSGAGWDVYANLSLAGRTWPVVNRIR